MQAHLPIGVFDSGVGGLTVLKALRESLAEESFIYLGDTARLPYGSKSADTVTRYALQAADALVKRGIKLLVVACNTVSAFALPALQKQFAPLPVIGVIEPGAQAACKATKTGEIIVIATEGTIKNQAYNKAIAKLCPEIKILSQSCPLFVPLAEEGFLEGDIAEHVVSYYLTPLLKENHGLKPDCIVLGCTHYPALRNTIAKVVGQNMILVDSAHTTAEMVKVLLSQKGLQASEKKQTTIFLSTDAPERFARIASVFLQEPLEEKHIELIDL